MKFYIKMHLPLFNVIKTVYCSINDRLSFLEYWIQDSHQYIRSPNHHSLTAVGRYYIGSNKLINTNYTRTSFTRVPQSTKTILLMKSRHTPISLKGSCAHIKINLPLSVEVFCIVEVYPETLTLLLVWKWKIRG